MQNLYRCWCPDYNIDEADAKTMYAHFERDAVENYASYLHGFFDGKFAQVNINVKEANNHYAKTSVYSVKVVVEPKFYATKEK